MLWRNWYALILIIACITRDIIITMILIVERYENPHWWPQARHEIDYLEHTRWILKDTRRTHNLTWFDPNLIYVHKERTWESFINKLDAKRFNLPLDDTRVFTFPLNLYPDYKNVSFLYASSPYSSLSWLFKAFFAF